MQDSRSDVGLTTTLPFLLEVFRWVLSIAPQVVPPEVPLLPLWDFEDPIRKATVAPAQEGIEARGVQGEVPRAYGLVWNSWITQLLIIG